MEARMLIICLMVIAISGPALGQVCSQSSANWQTCSYESTIIGKYTINNNMWASSSGSCMWASSEKCWGASSTYSDDGGYVKSYLSAFRGNHFGQYSSGDTSHGLTIRNRDITYLTAKWDMQTPKAGRYMALWDIYFRPDTAQYGDYIANLMLFQYYYDGDGWIGGSDDVEGAPQYLGKVTVGGHTWRVKKENNNPSVKSGPILIFFMDPPKESAVIDIKAMIDWAVAQGHYQPDWYLSVVEAGWEMIETGPSLGGGKFTTTDFQIAIGNERISGTTACTNGATQACSTGQQGICSTGTQTCSNSAWGTCTRTSNPIAESCTNSLDDDCDGRIDCADSDCSSNSICSQPVKYSGRIDYSNPSEPIIYYGGSVIYAGFQGRSVKARFREESNEGTKIGWVIDGGQLQARTLNTGDQEVTLASGLADATHSLQIIKLGGPGDGKRRLIFKGLVLDAGKTIVPINKPSSHRLEVFGDSVTEGASAGCASGNGDCGDNNAYYTYANRLARMMDAEIHNNGISGLAVRDNTGFFESGNTGLQTTWDKLNPSVEDGYPRTSWDFSRYNPDLIIFAMGVNDEYANGFNDVSAWKTTYKQIVRSLYTKYGNDKTKPVIFTVAPMWAGNAQTYAKQVSDELKAEGYNTWFYKFSYEANQGHPDIVEHEKMANELYSFIQSNNLVKPNICVHQADKNPCDGTISLAEICSYLSEWKQSTSIGLSDVMEAIRIWKG